MLLGFVQQIRLIEQNGLKGQRKVEPGLVACAASCVRDTDHSQRVGIENNCLAQDRWIGGEALFPESELQENYRSASHLLFFLRKTPADGGFEARRREKIIRFEPALHILRLCPGLPS